MQVVVGFISSKLSSRLAHKGGNVRQAPRSLECKAPPRQKVPLLLHKLPVFVAIMSVQTTWAQGKGMPAQGGKWVTPRLCPWCRWNRILFGASCLSKWQLPRSRPFCRPA